MVFIKSLVCFLILIPTTLFAGPVITSMQNYIDNNYPVAGYIVMSIMIIFFSLPAFFSEKGEEVFKYIILDRIIGIAFIFLAFFTLYTRFFQ